MNHRSAQVRRNTPRPRAAGHGPRGLARMRSAVVLGLTVSLSLSMSLSMSLGGCNGSSGIPNLTQSAFPLPGKEVYVGPRMVTSRYSHSATTIQDGAVLVVGGTDERHLTAIDAVEIFDQSARVDAMEPTPESISGDFIDQDIDGNLITMTNGGRFFHTATRINDGNVLVIGGTTSLIFGSANENSEIFDPETRSFTVADLEIDPDDDIARARVRHTATPLPNGKVLIAGGQETLTVIIPSGPNQGQSQDANATTEKMEIFDPATLAFTPALSNSGLPSELTTSRGRGGHAAARWAGFDQIPNTGDDVIGFVGGYQTLSAASLAAPDDLTPWNPLTTKLTSMDYYNTTDGTVNLAQGLVLTKRVNDPIAMNLGLNNRNTPFGDPGVANCVLVFGGDSDEACPDSSDGLQGTGSTFRAELLVATFSGFGPSNGIKFTRFSGPTLSTAAEGCFDFTTRSRTQGVLMEMLRTYDDEVYLSSVVTTGGGMSVNLIMNVCVQVNDGFCGLNFTKGFEFFDPFYNVFTDPPWDLEQTVNINTNPTGVVGTWIAYDAVIPDNSLEGFADALVLEDAIPANMDSGRLMHTLTRIPGEDGVLMTLDDRIVAIGGTDTYLPFFGDDPLSISCEIFLPPDAGVVAP